MRKTLVRLKQKIIKQCGWSLDQIDNTDFGNLLAFIGLDSDASDEGSTKVINGRVYKKSDARPAWW